MSRYAIVSDIHGNLPALEAVIADIAARDCAAVYNLGDCLSGPLWPRETADRLMTLGWPTIAGNHERQLIEGGDAMTAADRFAAATLDERHWAWLRAMPETRDIDGALLCHGSPRSDSEHLLFTIDERGLHEAEPDAVRERVGVHPERLIFCGHTHLPRMLSLADGRQVVNPGSVGLQAFRDTQGFNYVVAAGDAMARYAIVADGEVELVAIPYDHAAAAAKAEHEGFADWAAWLRTGRVSA